MVRELNELQLELKMQKIVHWFDDIFLELSPSLAHYSDYVEDCMYFTVMRHISCWQPVGSKLPPGKLSPR